MSQVRIEHETRLKHARERLAAYRKAEMEILCAAQSWAIGGQQMTRANLAEVRKGIRDAELEIEALLGLSRRAVKRVVPTDF